MTATDAAPPGLGEAPLQAADQRRISFGAFREMVVHLAHRELESKHQLTVLGWAWPLFRQLCQLVVLVFVFSKVFKQDIENFPVFVFIGLIAWTWFSAGIADAAMSISQQRHFVLQSRLPTAAVPLVSVAVPFVDVLIALPVLVVMLLVADELRWTILLCPLLLPVQFLLMAGIAWIASSAAVFFRDVPNIVYLGLTLAFYTTPVFYGARSVPDQYDWILEINPMATIIEEYRALLLGDPAPSATRLIVVGAGSVLLAGLGYLMFRRLRPQFADYL
jgi:lipopolysaccharide transport system permease protein